MLPLISNHLPFVATFMVQKGWPLKTDLTVLTMPLYFRSLVMQLRERENAGGDMESEILSDAVQPPQARCAFTDVYYLIEENCCFKIPKRTVLFWLCSLILHVLLVRMCNRKVHICIYI